MIHPVITVTLNPAIDHTVRLTQLHPGAVNHALGSSCQPGGKGVNVASCLADWGTPVQATGILGRDNADVFTSLFLDKGIGNRFVQQAGATRVNIKLASEQDGSTTDINLPGLQIQPETYARWLSALDALSEPDSIAVLSGSLPNGIADDSYAMLCARLQAQQVRVFLDSSGEPLRQALAGSALPYGIKPNREELAQWAGRPLPTLEAVAAEAVALHQRGVTQVVVSLGEQGALFVGHAGAWLGRADALKPISTVGAGDALLAGWVAAQHAGYPWEASIRLALAFASGKLARLGPHLPNQEHLRHLASRMQVTPLPA